MEQHAQPTSSLPPAKSQSESQNVETPLVDALKRYFAQNAGELLTV